MICVRCETEITPAEPHTPNTISRPTGGAVTRNAHDQCPDRAARRGAGESADGDTQAAPATVEPPKPTPGLIASLNVRVWLHYTMNDEAFPFLMLTYPAPQFEDVDPAAVEHTMRGVAASLGAAPLGEPLPKVGARVIRRDGDAFVWFADCPYALKVSQPAWARRIAELGHVLLAVGLDELSPVASRAEVDEYIATAGECGRMHVALADVGSTAREARAALALSGGAR